MNRTTTALAAAIALAISGSAFAKTKTSCDIVGTWTDDYGISATFTTETAGSAPNNGIVCPNTPTFSIKSKVKGTATWNLTATPDPKNSCKGTKITAALAFPGGGVCDTASGAITVPGYGELPDTWTQTGTVARHNPVKNSPLLQNLK